MKCYLCGSSQSTVMASPEEIRFGCFASSRRVEKCLACGLVQLYPPWSRKELDSLYRTYWRQEDFRGQRRKIKVSRYLAGMIGKGEVALEIGAGHGDNVRWLRRMGFNVYGIDKDPSVCDGRIIVNADVEKVRLKRRCDFIYAIHLFEHLADPRWFIGWLVKNLAPAGRFALEIPNVDDPLRVLYKNKAFQKFCWYPYHLFFYSRDTAERMFRGTGIDVNVTIAQEYGILNHLRWILFQRPGNRLPKIPIIDRIYAFILNRLMGIGDTLIITGRVCTT